MERESQHQPRPPLTVVASAKLNQIHVCEECGAAIVQRFDDHADRAEQHAAWHRTLEDELDRSVADLD